MVLRLLFALGSVLFGSAMAHAAPLVGDAEMHAVAASLRSGQFYWDDQRAADAPVTIAVSTILQRIYVYRGDALVGVASVSTGRRGHSTPRGDFTVLEKRRWHRSNIYANAPMPFMQRLTWQGIALHAGHNPGYPASHGCVRLPPAFARALFDMTALGAPVTIADYPAQSPIWLEIDYGDRDNSPRLEIAPDFVF